MIEYYINEILSEGVKFIAPWTEDGTQEEKSPTDGETLSPIEESSELEKTVCASDAEVTASQSPPSPASSRPRSDSLSSRSSLMLGASAANIAVPEADGGCRVICRSSLYPILLQQMEPPTSRRITFTDSLAN